MFRISQFECPFWPRPNVDLMERTATNSGDETMKTIEPTITGHKVVSREEWNAARKELLIKEKELTRLRDRLAAERRKTRSCSRFKRWSAALEIYRVNRLCDPAYKSIFQDYRTVL